MTESGICVIGSHNLLGIVQAADRLRRSGSPVDAVELAIQPTEDNPGDHGVGYGGWPNLLGEVECDAAIMEGGALQNGAVGALRGYRHPITIARHVMERLVHVLLVGEGAERFAAETGCERRDMLSAEARQVWAERIRQTTGLSDPEAMRTATDLARLGEWATDPERVGGTVTCIARDAEGHLATGVSTSGYAWKYPGRLGDSPIVGAGCYADDRYGAAACTGFGEWALSTATARSVVLYMKTGMPLLQAVAEAMRDLHHVALPVPGAVNLIAMDTAGNHVGATTQPPDVERRYRCATPGDDAPCSIVMEAMPPPPDTAAGRVLSAVRPEGSGPV